MKKIKLRLTDTTLF